MAFSESIYDFDEPPVTEVALSFGFLELGLHVGHIGRFWDTLADDFPAVDHQPPYNMPLEPLELGPVDTTPRVELMPPTMPRVWMKNEEGTKLIQVQSNWFAFNWRKAGSDDTYPRYQAVDAEFLTYSNRFVAFVEEQGLGDVAVTQAEVTYVNHITPPDGDLANAHRVLSGVAAGTGSFMPAPQQVRYNALYVIRHEERAVGRLHVTANPGFRKTDSTPIIQLSMTARGYPDLMLGGDATIENSNPVVAFMRLGREWIVNGFFEATTPEMHDKWGLHG